MVRYIVNESDYTQLKQGEDANFVDQYFIMTDDNQGFEKACSGQHFQDTPNSLSRDTLKMLYSMDVIVAGLLTVIGVCLILWQFWYLDLQLYLP